ncbi:DMT family transporter [Xanthomonas campestris]|uniref:DMT family transporter n=1 Tax=Xanthomonas campestris TaxID=339 RepID=UPI000E325524|nr:DMT family transporter [Xanthomonas campestris]MCC5072434.1 DMT family transporter [Xanthomonas campestris pv. plantaginis]MCW1981805.1 drug/metabolite transporter (DMT)-like permease [Xanthomonas campestris]MCW2007140.1 drug/metabolite transporter (DMT)-like permease [Xanthomonas campestris]MEA9787700.1 DMT family transporter [Xanthomonas campestris pv. raphani]MEA9842520.1 DMT family transporter [Xanthomonas campestris pv. raphani]
MSAQPSLQPALGVRDWRTPLELVFLGIVWGCSFLFMRVAAPHFGAAPLVEIRLALGATVLLPFLWVARSRFPLHRWPMLAAIGVLNSALPFLLFAWGAQHAPAAVGAICNAMTVLFTALIAFVFFGERIGTRRAVALLIGFIGVLVLATGKSAGLSVGPAALAGATASLLYGIGYNLVKRHMGDLPPAASAASTLGCSALLLAPVAWWQWPSAPVPASAWACAGALGVVCTGLAFLMYYRLIQRIGPARASTVTYLVPVFGALLAWALLGEALTWTMLLAAVLILGSVAFSQRAR